jgi:hypothetical protein
MHARFLICALALGAALIGSPPSLAQSANGGADEAAASAKPPSADDIVTALSSVTTAPTSVDGLTVKAKRRSTSVDGLTVVASMCPQPRKPADPEIPAPKLVSTFPSKGATVRPGVLVLRLTFDKPMTCDGLLDSVLDGLNPCPAPLLAPLFSRDRRTFVTVCRIEGGNRYGLRLDRFTSLAGHPLGLRYLAFATSQDRPIASIRDAMVQDEFLREAAEKLPRAAP